MPTFHFSFNGCTKGAIGVTHPCTAKRTARTREQAEVDLYDEYERIGLIKATVLPMEEHKNERYNIIQFQSNKPDFVVIEGKRLPSGHAAPGAKVLTGAMCRDEAIRVADIMQRTCDRSQRRG